MPAIDWSPFVELVNQHRRFLLTTHVRPDGDALGSMLALGRAMERRGKAVDMAVASPLPPRYAFLDPPRPLRPLELPREPYRPAQAIHVLDPGTPNHAR